MKGGGGGQPSLRHALATLQPLTLWTAQRATPCACLELPNPLTHLNHHGFAHAALPAGAEGAVYAAWFLESPVAVKKFNRVSCS